MRDKACHPLSEVSHNEVPQAWPELYSFFSSISLSLCLSLSHTHTAHSLSLSLTHTHTHTHTHIGMTLPACPCALQGCVRVWSQDTGHSLPPSEGALWSLQGSAFQRVVRGALPGVGFGREVCSLSSHISPAPMPWYFKEIPHYRFFLCLPGSTYDLYTSSALDNHMSGERLEFVIKGLIII